MLYEIKSIQQNPGEPARRWFADQKFDLLVWISEQNLPIGFQLSYEQEGIKKALTWYLEKGFFHDIIDDGEEGAGRPKMSPILTADGICRIDDLMARFEDAARRIDPEILEFVLEKLNAYKASTAT